MRKVTREDLKECPNANTRPASVIVHKDSGIASVEGYQCYDVYNSSSLSVVPIDPRTINKDKKIEPYMNNLKGQSVLDLGCGPGYFSFLAASKGATHVHAVDMDQECIDVISKVRIDLNINSVTTGAVKLPCEFKRQYDNIFCLALSHWLYEMTADMESNRNVLNWLEELWTGRGSIFTETVYPHDPAIVQYEHYKGGGESVSPNRRFGTVRRHIKINESRRVSIISVTAGAAQVDIHENSIFPFVSKCYPQNHKERANRDLQGLEKFYGPLGQEGVSATNTGMVIWKYLGDPLTKENLPDNWEYQAEIILSRLAEVGIAHNDMRPGNLVVDEDGQINPIDFEWHTKAGDPIPEHWPRQLGGRQRKGDHNLDDRYSLIKSLEEVRDGKV